MNKTIATFLLVAVLAGLLAAASIAVGNKGYAFGTLGLSRLDGLANAATFIPLAAIYSFSAMLMMVLPLRAAGFVHAAAAAPLFSATLVLLATIVGVQAARLAFGDYGALWRLADWQFAFAAAILIAHPAMSTLRSDTLLRTLFFAAFAAAALACLFWTFRL